MAARRFGNVQFAGPPNVGGMDLGSILKLAGYGDKEGGYVDPSDQIRWMIEQTKAGQERAKEEREGRQFTTKEERERTKSEADIKAGQTESAVKLAELQRKIAEMEQGGRGSAITALSDLAKAFPTDKEATARYENSLAKLIPELAQTKAEEKKAATGARAGEINKAMIPIYQKGNKGVLAAQMASLEPEFQQNPELMKALPWSRYSELWPVTDATAATAQSPRAQAPAPTAEGGNTVWNYLTGTHGVPQTETKAALTGPLDMPSVEDLIARSDYFTPTDPDKYKNDPRFMPVEDVLARKVRDWWNAPREPLVPPTAYPSVEDLVARSQYQTPAEPQVAAPAPVAQAPVAPQLPSPGSVPTNYQYGTGVQVPENLTSGGAPSTGIMDFIRRLWGGGEEQRLPYTYGNPLPPSQQLPPPVAQRGNLLDVLR